MLDYTENYIKDNLQNIIDGKFEPDQLKMMLEMSFLYNHISFENNSVIFEYNRVKFEISDISEIPDVFAKEQITSSIKNDVVFKSALKQFLRDKKINEILE